MDGGIARSRLSVEHRSWRIDHPHGFVARPETGFDGAVNLMVWHCFIPGKPTTDWKGGFYPITMHFREIYPYKPSKCKFPQGFFHPNVYPSRKVYLPSILNDDIVTLILQDNVEYKRRVRQQAEQYPALF